MIRLRKQQYKYYNILIKTNKRKKGGKTIQTNGPCHLEKNDLALIFYYMSILFRYNYDKNT